LPGAMKVIATNVSIMLLYIPKTENNINIIVTKSLPLKMNMAEIDKMVKNIAIRQTNQRL
jgi:hypothetical protein